MRDFDKDIQAPIAVKQATRTTPDKTSNILIWLVFVAGAVVLYIILAAMVMSKHLYMNVAGWLGFLTIAGVLLLVFIDRDMIRSVEQIIGHDLDGDGYIGAPQTHIEFKPSERTAWMAQLPAPEPLIREWGQAALGGRSLGYRQWQNRFALMADGSDGMQRYANFRDAMVRAQLAVEQGKSGIQLTDRGVQVFTEFVHQNPVGTPLLEG